jgi:S-adenosylmethionine uptake transporter
MSRAPSLLPFLSVGAGIATFSVMDALMKIASIEGGVYSALLLRSLVGTALMLPIWSLLARAGWPARPALRIHALRSAVVATMAGLFFWGLVRLPMAEAMALSFIAPLIALFLAAAVLGEKIRPSAIVASLLGLAGVGVIAAARFGAGGDLADTGPGVIAVLLSAVFYAWNLILQRQQAQLSSPVEVALFQNVFMVLYLAAGVICLALLAGLPGVPERAAEALNAAVPGAPSAAMLRAVSGSAALAAISLMLLSWGYARAEAQALVPLEYTGFVWAALTGWFWFDEPVTARTLTGTALIVFGCWIATRRTGEPHMPVANLPPAP